MVRQDKITYLTSCFDWQEVQIQYPSAAPLAGLIGLLLVDEIAIDPNDTPYREIDEILQHYPSLDNLQSEKSEFESKIFNLFDSNISDRLFHLFEWFSKPGVESRFKNLADQEIDEFLAVLKNLSGLGSLKSRYFACAFFNKEILPVNAAAGRVLMRFGIVPIFESMTQLSQMLNPYIPYGRHYFLWVHLNRYANTICHEDAPQCTDCCLAEFCDFHLNKNQWAIS